ncbi:MAG: winged helix-turn-helix domain-containing protein [Proteobacteria bacterium]|nr:winged helix-turn-helix domain-containing protein [Pseudomonadota bacterium]
MQFKIESTLFVINENSLKINNSRIECHEKVRKALILFLNSENKTISKEYIIKDLWGSLIVSDDSLFKVIQSLRQLFKDNNLSGNVLINVYGKGYKINPQIETLQNTNLTKNSIEKNLTQSLVKRIIPVFLVLLLAIIGGVTYFNLNQNKETISTFSYHSYKEKIKLGPKDFLLSIDIELKKFTLSKIDLIRLYSLKGFANFNQGQYKKSLAWYEQAIELNDNQATIAIADSYFIMALINYKSNDKELLKYLNKSNEIYSKLENQDDGIFKTNYLKIEYLSLTHKYHQAILAGEKLLKESKQSKNVLGELYALTTLYRVHQLSNHHNKAKKHIKMALDVALKVGNGKYISYSYGSMAVDSMNEGDFVNAMNWANQTLKYAVEQPNTNNFQQGFSYIYNILSPLGHDDLAEKYLQKAIDVQYHLNSDGNLHTAEINLGILKVKLKKHQEAKKLFSDLLSYNLSIIDKLTTQAWISINQYHLSDNISAYAIAKEVYQDENTNNNIKFVAGIALMASSIELERFDEGQSVFESISKIANPNWLIEYKLYLDMTLMNANILGTEMTKDFTTRLKQNNKRLTNIKSQTQPNKKTLDELDNYLAVILN